MLWMERRRNKEVLEKVGVRRELPSSVKVRLMRFLGHVMRSKELEHLSLMGKMEGRRPIGSHKKKYVDGFVRGSGGRMFLAQLLQKTMLREEWQSMVTTVRGDMAPQ